MNKIKKNELGFGAVELILLLVIVIAISGLGYYIYKAKQTTTASYSSATSASTVSKSTTSPKTTNQTATINFFSCASGSGTVSSQGQVKCTLNSKTYVFPSVFTTDDITSYNQVPAAAQSLVNTIAKQNFDGCAPDAVKGTSNGAYPSTTVDIANTSFVDMLVSNCDSGFHEEFGLQGGQWTDLGANQFGLACTDVSTYKISQSSIIANKSSFDTCYNSDGTTQPIPN